MKSLIFLLVLANTFAYSQKSISERLSQKEAKAKTITYLIDASYATQDRTGSMIFVNNVKNEWINKPTNYAAIVGVFFTNNLCVSNCM